MATLADLLGGGENPLMGLLSPEQQAQAKQQAQSNLLTQLGFGLLQASRGAPGTGKPSLGQIVGQVGPSAVSAYQGSFDKTLKDLITSMQVKDMMAKREREANLQKALQGAMQPTMTMADYGRAQSNIDPMALESGMSATDVLGQATPTGPATVDRNRALAALAQYGGPEGIAAYLASTKPQELPGIVGEFSAARRAGIIPAETTFEQYAAMKRSPANVINVGGKPSPFQEASEKKQAEVFSGIQESGLQAQRTTKDIQRLSSILEKVDTGGVAAFKQAAGNLGIKTEGLNDIQAAQAIINKLVPQQRPPGSGTMSDADLALYKESLPRIINQPGANKQIIQSMKEINDYLVKEGQIAADVLDGKISVAEGRKRLLDLGNPVQDFFEKNPAASPGRPVAPMNQQDENLINKYLKR